MSDQMDSWRAAATGGVGPRRAQSLPCALFHFVVAQCTPQSNRGVPSAASATANSGTNWISAAGAVNATADTFPNPLS